jgi:hypothetical protein
MNIAIPVLQSQDPECVALSDTFFQVTDCYLFNSHAKFDVCFGSLVNFRNGVTFVNDEILLRCSFHHRGPAHGVRRRTGNFLLVVMELLSNSLFL